MCYEQLQFDVIITINSAEGNKSTLKDVEAGLVQIPSSSHSNPPNYFLAARYAVLSYSRTVFSPEDVDLVSKFKCSYSLQLHTSDVC